jgi:hypothetical protein
MRAILLADMIIFRIDYSSSELDLCLDSAIAIQAIAIEMPKTFSITEPKITAVKQPWQELSRRLTTL